MGLVRGLLLGVPLAPVSGLRWLITTLADEAERELATRESPSRALADLEARRATGEISEADADALESELIELMLSAHGGD